MTSYCIHHPQKPSHWHCPLCKGEFCDTCAQKKTQNGLAVTRTIALCPRCNREMEWVGNINAITPFWKRLPRFFLYPFKVSVILFVVFLACLSSLLAKPTLTSGLLQFTSYALLVRYAYLVLRTTASGNLEPPDVGGFPLKSGIIIIFKQGVLFFLMGLIAAGSAALLGPSSLIFVFLIFALFFPAMMILLVSSNRVLHAINPVAFVRLALSMGKGYLGMFALLTILWGAPALVMKYLAPIMSFRTLQFSTFVISGYYMLVSYHLMGYVTLQYHRKIGYEIDVENFTGETPPPVQSPPS
ncbi:MAG: DUF4013 domain-containing protein, partial [Desulfobacterales bacterium]|nr:DUF4013 domain-containing protein [Desulfobacterales bacterium]